eukprot:Nk52_evm60s208 gene=Nk52_evmTU60s208
MSKGTTIKDAIARWVEKSGEQPADMTKVKLYMQIPPIEKMDASLSVLTACEHLALSTNAIEKISNLNGLKNLKVLSIGRNNIKKLENLDPVAETLEQLWMSYNLIEKLKGINVLKNLKILYMSNNKVKEWGEFEKLQDLPKLEELIFTGNPLEEKYTADGTWRSEVAKRLPHLKKLDGVPIVSDEPEDEGGE